MGWTRRSLDGCGKGSWPKQGSAWLVAATPAFFIPKVRRRGPEVTARNRDHPTTSATQISTNRPLFGAKAPPKQWYGCLIGVYLTGVHLTEVHLMGVHLMGYTSWACTS